MTGVSDNRVLESRRIGPVFAAMVLVLGLVIFAGAINPAAARPSRATIVVDWKSGRVVSAYHPDKLHAPASLTKVMTLYLVFEALANKRLKIDQPLKISRQAQRTRPSRLGLRAGGTITVRHAILALVTKSANDAAVVLAEAMGGGSESYFGLMMTAKARKLGMLRTTFRNASGLPASGQLTTARDLAILARSIISEYPQYYYFFSTRSFKYRGRSFGNHNRLLGRYPGVDGLKTGFVRASGHNLMISARNKVGRRVIAVVLGGRSRRDRDRRMTALLNKSFGKQPIYAKARTKTTKTVLARRTRRRAARRRNAGGLSSFATKRYRRYSVQVGAYRSRRYARRATYRAARRLSQYRGTRRRILRSRSGRIYLARLQGFSRKQAYSACRALRRAKQNCAVYGPRRSRRSRS